MSLPVRYRFIFDCFGASQTVYRNLWCVKSRLLKEICLLYDQFVIYLFNDVQAHKTKQMNNDKMTK